MISSPNPDPALPARDLSAPDTEPADEEPHAVMVAGPNGSGKTTVTEQGLAHEWFAGCEYINPDVIARDEFGDWNDPAAVLAAAKEATTRRDACSKQTAKRRSGGFQPPTLSVSFPDAPRLAALADGGRDAAATDQFRETLHVSPAAEPPGPSL